MEGDISYIHVCAPIMLTNQRAEACVMDGKNYGQQAYAHTHKCVCGDGVETGMHLIYIYDSCVTVNGFLSLS